MPETDPERIWLERELSELRAREARCRERFGYSEALSARLSAHSEAVHQFLRRRPSSRRELSATLRDVARLSAQALGISRSSVWRIDPAQTELRCVVQLEDDREQPVQGVVLAARECPSYVRALAEETALAVDDALTDVRTRELTVYLREHHVSALLDIPIVIAGALEGVVCHEHVGAPRRWERAEIDFAASIGQLVALVLETERRMSAEYAARGTEAKYKHLVESLPVTVYSFDVRTAKLEYVSPRAFELGGWSAQDWLARGPEAWVSQIHAEDRAPVLQRFQQGAAGGFPEEVTYRVRLPDGRTRWVRDSCHVVRDHLGHPVAIQGVLADVTEQREAELSRIEFERRYRTLLENVDVVAVSLDTQGRATFVNDAFVRVSGFSRQELIGADWFSTVLPAGTRDGVRRRFLDDIAKGTVAPRFELSIVTKGGETRQLLCANTVLCASDGTAQGSSSLALDMTDRRKLERELLQQTKLESLGRLAAGVAHDFNNLLMVMTAQLSLLARELPDGLVATAAQRLTAIEQAVDQASELTRSLLVYGRRQPASTESFTLDELVRDAMPLLEAVVGGRLGLSTSLHAGDARLKLDRSRVRQVLVNIVGNAVDATTGKGKSIRIATHVELVDDATARRRGAPAGGEFAVLSVVDDGRGMDPRTVQRIFDPFFTTKQDGRGTGLGLAIAQTVASQAGGFITVDSAPETGATFRVHFPLRPAGARSVAPPSPSSESLAKRVLVVEDIGVIRDVIADTLRAAGYDVQTAPDSRSATELLGSASYDLLVTDVNLPDGSGSVLAKSARSVRPSLRVVVMSGSGDIDDERFDGTLEKPFDDAQLLEAVRAALAGDDSER